MKLLNDVCFGPDMIKSSWLAVVASTPWDADNLVRWTSTYDNLQVKTLCPVMPLIWKKKFKRNNAHCHFKVKETKK